MDAAAASPPRPPNPKPLLAVLMVVAFFGGPCTVQTMVGPSGEVPSDQEIATLLGEAAKDPVAGPRLVAATQAMVTEQAHVAQRFHPYAMVFGLVLVTLYLLAFVFGLRAWNFAYGALGPLSKVSLAVLPARVAVAAVDLATSMALQPAGFEFAKAQADQLQSLTRALAQVAPWVTVTSALAVCALFQFAWRYFQRADVVAWYDKAAGPPPEE